jgi:hypothetical protein
LLFALDARRLARPPGQAARPPEAPARQPKPWLSLDNNALWTPLFTLQCPTSFDDDGDPSKPLF